MALTKATYSLIEGAPLNVLDFGAAGDDSNDDTAAIQAAFTEAASSGRAVYIPAGTYKTTASLTIANDIIVYGDGRERSTIKLYTASTATFALVCDIPDNFSVIGLDIGHIGIQCNGGAAKGCGIYLNTTATNSAFSQSALHDLYIRNATTGVSLNGVIYMSEFSRITVVGADDFGWRSTPIAGQIIYNTFQNLEVTGVGDNAYAYYMTAPSCHFKNLTADGCGYFSGAYLCIDGYAIEGLSATTPASNYAIECVQVMSVRNVDIINIPTAKCQYGLSILGPNFSLSGIRIPDAGAGNQPDRILNLYVNNTGTISDVYLDRSVVDKLEDYLSESILNGFVFTGCDSITDRSLTYQQGTWTPTFPANWTTPPTTVSARYVKIGKQVTATFYGQDGVSLAGAQIGGLPFAANATAAFAAAGASSDTTKDLRGSILSSESIIKNIPAQTLTGTFWQMTATYFV